MLGQPVSLPFERRRAPATRRADESDRLANSRRAGALARVASHLQMISEGLIAGGSHGSGFPHKRLTDRLTERVIVSTSVEELCATGA